LHAEGRIGRTELIRLVKDVTSLMSNQSEFTYHLSIETEPNTLKLSEPVVIIGDIHGQFYDMLHMFEKVIDSRSLAEYLDPTFSYRDI
jgi:serine/threonine-protein phosphatase 2B catalytic subunit